MQLPTSVTELRSRHSAGEHFSYLCFWGHRPRPDGAPSNSCFSQWYPAQFEIEGVIYPTAEHYMMAEKARLFGDSATLEKVLKASDPGAAKAFGREVSGFSETVWNEQRFNIVVRGNLAKFGQDARLSEYLLKTGRKVLVEASPVDSIWGIGLAADDVGSQDPNSWNGLNLLGFALMAVRDRLS